MAPFSSEILYFTGANCRICKLMTPLVADVAEEFDGEVRLTQMDAAEFSCRAREYDVMAVPTLVALVDGVETGRQVGAQTPGSLMKLFRSASSGTAVKPTMNPRDRLLRLMFAAALGVLAISTGQLLVWPFVAIALIAAFWDMKP
jgi:thiol-disulfide isomerase/thioredoxin